jgi:pimeloyl-ACP methyl ester carboxylesterase
MDELDIESWHMVGHDWGAALAWSLAINEPTRVNRLVVISAPHGGVSRGVEQHEKFVRLKSPITTGLPASTGLVFSWS